MKKGTIVTGTVTERLFPNKGVLPLPEGRCIVKNTLPGQTVEARITKKRGDRLEAVLVRVLSPSPLEQGSPCPRYGICGGCASLTLPYEEECRMKEAQVRKILTDALSGSPDADLSWFEGLLPSPDAREYRNKMEFSFGNSEKDGPLTLGMHRRGSFYDVIDADTCVLVDGDFRAIVRETVSYFRAAGTSFFHRMRKEGCLRHLLVRKAANTGEILVDLVTSSQIPDEDGGNWRQCLETYAQRLRELPLQGRLQGILHTVNDSVADVVRDDGTEVLWGSPSFREQLLGLTFEITPFSFFQTNSRGAELLYTTARNFLLEAGIPKGTVYDLYCGTGTITQLMAPVSEKVIGVEIVEEAVEAAKVNAARNGLTNCTFIAGDVLKVLDTIEEKPDTIILDPPRDGIHPKALPRILSYGVENILYISCKPTSLARDLPAFVAAGYRPVRGVCVDQFPWTSSVETICLLSLTDG
jgi:23S rRNA (uracil-5-)-methyltransferase RumA